MSKKIRKSDDWVNFILRRIETGVITNTMMGGFYSYIEKNKNPDVFNELVKEWSEEDLKGCYAIVTFFDKSFMPIYEDSDYYVMTDTGGTFEKL